MILKTFKKICSKNGSELHKNTAALKKAIQRYFPHSVFSISDEELISLINKSRQDEINKIGVNMDETIDFKEISSHHN
jgi:hypothetical protein